MRSSFRISRFYLISLASITFNITPLAVRADEPGSNLTAIPDEKSASAVVLNDAMSGEVGRYAIVPLEETAAEDAVVVDAFVPSAPMRLAQAEESSEPVPATIEAEDPTKAHVTSPYVFHEGLRERDFSIGFGSKIGISSLHDRERVDMFQVLPRWGRFRNSSQEILWEVPITLFTRPDTSFLGGVTLMFRQHLSRNRHFAPYVEFGPGLTVTNLKTRDLGGSFQYSLQGGVGVRTSLSEDSDLVIGARWFHLSNGGVRAPNRGLNNYLITVGYSKLY